ncbi:hypothetical protein GCM10020254_43570 [Streptomyces goshikiensis]
MGEIFAGRYELADPIGRGGAGAVWRAWDHRRRRYVAAKVLLQSDAHTLLRFVREQAVRIDHPPCAGPPPAGRRTTTRSCSPWTSSPAVPSPM